MTPSKPNTRIKPREVFLENLKFLREYARRLLVEDDDTLVPIADFKDVVAKEYLTVGAALGLTERDLMVLLFKSVLEQRSWH